jgi:hypothetical protein
VGNIGFEPIQPVTSVLQTDSALQLGRLPKFNSRLSLRGTVDFSYRSIAFAFWIEPHNVDTLHVVSQHFVFGCWNRTRTCNAFLRSVNSGVPCHSAHPAIFNAVSFSAYASLSALWLSSALFSNLQNHCPFCEHVRFFQSVLEVPFCRTI